MDYKLNIGKLTETIKSYENICEKLQSNSEQRNSILNNLFTDGWSGNSKTEFEKQHKDNEKIYNTVPRYIQYLNNALEKLEKPKAVDLKRNCENFVNIVTRIGNGGEVSSEEEGTISLLTSGVTEIGNIIDTCDDSYFISMQNKLNGICDTLDSLKYKSFVLDDVNACQSSLNEQKNHLNDFKYALGIYNQSYAEMETALISKLDSIINGKQGKHRAYIFYQPGIVSGDKAHKFDDQAQIEKLKYERDYPGTEVVLVEVKDPKDFKEKWNDMDDIGADIDAVQVILHGSAYDDNDDDEYTGAGFLFFTNPNDKNDKSSRIVTDKNILGDSDNNVLISDFNKKEINHLYFSTCNSANPDIQNVSDEFDKIVDANSITGFDGTALYYYNDINPIASYEDESPKGAQEYVWNEFVKRDSNGIPIRVKDGKITKEDRY